MFVTAASTMTSIPTAAVSAPAIGAVAVSSSDDDTEECARGGSAAECFAAPPTFRIAVLLLLPVNDAALRSEGGFELEISDIMTMLSLLALRVRGDVDRTDAAARAAAAAVGGSPQARVDAAPAASFTLLELRSLDLDSDTALLVRGVSM